MFRLHVLGIFSATPSLQSIANIIWDCSKPFMSNHSCACSNKKCVKGSKIFTSFTLFTDLSVLYRWDQTTNFCYQVLLGPFSDLPCHKATMFISNYTHNLFVASTTVAPYFSAVSQHPLMNGVGILHKLFQHSLLLFYL